MMLARILVYAVVVFAAISAVAQQPVTDPGDFVDPAMLTRPLFMSHFVTGFISSPADHYRPVDGNTAFVMITNSLYAGNLQFDYKHRESFGKDAPLQRCDCPDPVYFPTPPPGNGTPAGPPPGRSDTVQAAFYRVSDGGASTLRYRASFVRQEIGTNVTSISTSTVEHRSGQDLSFTVDADTHFNLAGRSFWGSLFVARTSRSGPPDRRAQNEYAYVHRPPGWAAGPVLFLPKLTVGHINDREGTGLNLINPYLETYWYHVRTKASIHLVWSAEWTNSGVEGWRNNNQIAVYLTRPIYVKSFGGARDE